MKTTHRNRVVAISVEQVATLLPNADYLDHEFEAEQGKFKRIDGQFVVQILFVPQTGVE